MNKPKKAYIVRNKDEFACEALFAETAGKARALALSTDSCEYSRFIDIEVRRAPNLDKYYKEGKWGFDWDDPKDRIALVREEGFRCDEDTLYYEDCNTCPAKEYCDVYLDKQEEVLIC